MHETLHLTLFGSPRIRLGEQPLTDFATNKAQALLFYLTVTGQPHSRDGLATLLWDGMTDTQAKKNLRNVLPDLRRLLGDHVQIERQTVAFDRTSPYWLDVETLRHNLTPGSVPVDLSARQAAIELYGGEFLSGFYVHNAPAFDAWVLEQREQCHALVVEALAALAHEHVQRADYGQALSTNRRLLALEPWSEPVHRQQMWLLAQTGDRAAALAQYETCRRVLATEFGVAPLTETTALYQQIRAGEIARPEDSWIEPKGAPIEVRASVRQDDANPEENGSGHTGQSAVERHTDDEQMPPRSSHGQRHDHPLPYNLPHQTKFYGRQEELARLQRWIVAEGCAVVGVFGIGGQGKTALTVTLVRALAEGLPPPHPMGSLPHAGGGTDSSPTRPRLPPQTGEGWGGVNGFTHILWQPLLNAPPLAEVLQEWFCLLSDQTVTHLPTSLDQQLGQLVDYLQQQRCLLVLDNLESILQGDGRSGYYRPGYEDYGQLIGRLAAGGHRSCLLLTSRECPQDLTHLAEETPTVRFLSLTGLPADSGQQMLQARGLANEPTGLGALVQHYSGNPLALNLAAETIQEIFQGDIAAFLRADTLVFDDIRDVLDQQFARLTPLECELLLWHAIVREPIDFHALRSLLAQPPAPRLVLEAMRSLQRRSLLEKYDEGFGLQNVVMEYATDRLVEDFGFWILDFGLKEQSKIQNPKSKIFNRYALVLAQVKEYVRASQTRLLLRPVAEGLVAQRGSTGAAQQLQSVLVYLRETAPRTPGYAAANLLHLLLHIGADLSGFDFSQLYFRQLALRGVRLPQTTFVGAEISESVFTEPFGLVYTAVFSPDGHYLAAGTGEGAIYLWRTADQQLVQVLQAHSHAVHEVAFGQRLTPARDRQLVLASAADDKRVGVWSLAEGGQARLQLHLAHEQQGVVLAVNVLPDGQRVTSVDDEGHVSVWDVSREEEESRLVQHFDTTPTRLRFIAFSEDGQTVVVGNRDGTVHIRPIATPEAGRVFREPTGSLGALALRSDGGLLATGNKNGQIYLWTVPTGQRQPVVESNGGLIDALAFSPDGRTLASSHRDYAIRVWRIDAQLEMHLRHTLVGHTHVVWSVALSRQPALHGDGNHARRPLLLASGSSDQTVRVWDTETGQSLYTLRGQPRALGMLAISPLPKTQRQAASATHQEAEWILAAVGYDQLVHLWQGRGVQAITPRRALSGQRGLLYTVAISPDSRTVASAGVDRSIWLWDVASGQVRHQLHGHTDSIYGLTFHPAGMLLASCSTDGTVRLWDLRELEQMSRSAAGGSFAERVVAVLQAHQNYVYDMAFSPDGRLLASVGAERWLRLWDMTQRHRPELVAARKTVAAEGEYDIYSVAFSPDGTKLACGDQQTIHLWTLPNDFFERARDAQPAEAANDPRPAAQAGHDDESPLHLRHHTNWIFALAFSPDSTLLASGGADCTVCLWDTRQGTLCAVLHGHSETVFKVAFCPDGASVVSCSFDGTIKFWHVQTGDCVNTLFVEGPYTGMNITGVTGVTEAQKAALKALGAVEE